MPIVVYFILLEKLMKKGLFQVYLPLADIAECGSYGNAEAVQTLHFGLLVGTITMLFMVPIAAVVTVPVVIYQVWRLIWAFGIRFICCWCIN